MKCLNFLNKKNLKANNHILDKYILDNDYIYTCIDISGNIHYQNKLSKQLYTIGNNDILSIIFKHNPNSIEELLECIRNKKIFDKNLKVCVEPKDSGSRNSTSTRDSTSTGDSNNKGHRTSLEDLSNNKHIIIEDLSNNKLFKLKSKDIESPVSSKSKENTVVQGECKFLKTFRTIIYSDKQGYIYISQRDITENVLNTILSNMQLVHLEETYPVYILKNYQKDYNNLIKTYENKTLLMVQIKYKDMNVIEHLSTCNRFINLLNYLSLKYDVHIHDNVQDTFILSTGLYTKNKEGKEGKGGKEGKEGKGSTNKDSIKLFSFALDLLNYNTFSYDLSNASIKLAIHNGSVSIGLLETVIPKIYIYGECIISLHNIIPLTSENTMIATSDALNIYGSKNKWKYFRDIHDNTYSKTLVLYQMSRNMRSYDLLDYINIDRNSFKFSDLFSKITFSDLNFIISKKN